MLNDDVKAFHREMSNYRFYHQHIKDLKEKVELKYDQLGASPRSPKMGEPTHGSMLKDVEYQIREDISELEANIKLTRAKIDFLDKIFAQLSKTAQRALNQRYRLNRKSWQQVADEMHYTRTGLQYTVNQELRDILKKGH